MKCIFLDQESYELMKCFSSEWIKWKKLGKMKRERASKKGENGEWESKEEVLYLSFQVPPDIPSGSFRVYPPSLKGNCRAIILLISGADDDIFLPFFSKSGIVLWRGQLIWWFEWCRFYYWSFLYWNEREIILASIKSVVPSTYLFTWTRQMLVL